MIAELIKEELIFTDINLKHNTKREALNEISNLCAQNNKINPKQLRDNLLEREEIATTGIGKGVAIPHGRVDGLNQIEIVIAKFTEGIDWDALDDEEVRVVIAIIVPINYIGDMYLTLIKELARKLMHDEFVNELVSIDEPSELYKYIISQMK